MKRDKYIILSPDGLGIEMMRHFKEKDVPAALDRFVKNYEFQGYYSTIRDGERLRIPLEEIKDYCKIIKL